MNLRVTKIGDAGAALVGAPDGGGIRAAGIGGKIEDISVPARGEHHRISGVAGDPAGLEIAHDDALGVAVHDDEVEHLGVRVGHHVTEANLPA